MKIKRRSIYAVGALVFLTGCQLSIYQMLYNSIDTFVVKKVDSYFDINRSQEQFIKARMKAFLEWHRSEELVKYIVSLRKTQAIISTGIDEKGLMWLIREGRGHVNSILRKALDDTVEFLMTLEERQIEYFNNKMGDEITKMEEDIDSSGAKQAKNYLWALSVVYGDLSREQKDEVRGILGRIDDISRERIRYYRESRDNFVAILKKRPGRGGLRRIISDLSFNPEKGYPEYYRERSERFYRQHRNAFLAIEKNLITRKQRDFALKRIDEFIGILQILRKG